MTRPFFLPNSAKHCAALLHSMMRYCTKLLKLKCTCVNQTGTEPPVTISGGICFFGAKIVFLSIQYTAIVRKLLVELHSAEISNYSKCVSFNQGLNGVFTLSVMDGSNESTIFDIIPPKVVQTATARLRVKDPTVIDYERSIKKFNFHVSFKQEINR